MQAVFLALFVLVSGVHLYGSFQNNRTIRNDSKGGILLALLGYYLCSVSQPSWIVVLAILFSWLGDVLLILHGTRFFAAGGISFLVSHVFFILAYLPNVRFSAVPVGALIALTLVYAAAVFLVFRALKIYLPRMLCYPMMLYLAVNGAMNIFALMQLISRPCLASALVFIGAVLFFVSDSTLFFVRFHQKQVVWRRHFPVMLTYILAEFLIVQGVLMLSV